MFARDYIGLLKAALEQIRNAVVHPGISGGLNNLSALVAKIQGLVDPAATEVCELLQESAETGAPGDAAAGSPDDKPLGPA
jgi:hypothetical protein